jgi:hypothetical protein
MDLNGWHAHLEHSPAIYHGFGSQFRHGEAKRLDGGEQPRRILERWADERVESAGDSRGAVERQGVCADYDELNPMGSQGPDELVEVGRELHRPASADTPPPRGVPLVAATATSVTPGVSVLPPPMTSGARLAEIRVA